MKVKTTVELQDHKTKIIKVPRLADHWICTDALWVQCPWNAVGVKAECTLPDVECEHRNPEPVQKWVEDLEVVDLEATIMSRKGEETPKASTQTEKAEK